MSLLKPRIAFCWILLALVASSKAFAHTPEEKSFYLQSRIVLKLNPTDAVAGNAVGVWHLEYNELDISQAAFRKVLLHHPENILAQLGNVLVTENRGEYDQALAAATESHLRPDSIPAGMRPFASLVLARLYLHQQDYPRAQTLLADTVEQAANPHDHFFWLGRVQEAQGSLEKAIPFYQKAIEADPFWLPPYSRLSRIYQQQGNTTMARKLLQDIVLLENPSPYPNNDIGVMWRFTMNQKPY